jgi:methyl-accepting chemotaxis protein
MKIFARILTGYAATLLILLSVAVVALVQVGQMEQATNRVVSDAMPARHAGDDVLAQVVNEQTGVWGFVLSGRFTPGGVEGFLDPYTRGKAALPADLNELTRFGATDTALIPLIAVLSQELDTNDAYNQSQIALVRQGVEGDSAAAGKVSDGKQAVDAIRRTAADIQVEIGRTVTSLSTQSRNAATNARLMVGLIFALAIVITLGMGVYIARSISVPLAQITVAANRIGDGELIETPRFARQDEIGVLAGALTRMMQSQRDFAERARTTKEELARTITRYIAFVAKVADRDLSGTLEVTGNGEIAALGKDLNKMNANLRELAVQIQDATNDLGSGVSEILAAASEQTSSAATQATAIQQTTATINAIRTNVEQTSQRSGQVASMARDSVKATDDGRGSVESTIESMAAIKTQVEGIAQNILALSGQGQQIGDIITTVNDFAEQSNLLALNAAIEAARAGEHGKGFAVVASEVRNLAEQSKVATTRVRELLSEIQKATNSAVMVTEEGLKGVASGSKNVDGAGTAIKSLSETIRQTAQTAEQIAIAVQQQTVGMEQIAVAMGEINQVTAQALAGSRQTQQSAQNITELSERMSKLARSYILS